MLSTRLPFSYGVLTRCLRKQTSVPTANSSSIKKLGGKISAKSLGPTMEKKVLPVETDPEKLVTYCCGSNIYKTGEDVKLQEDSEYPEWLWSMRVGKPPPISELDPETLEYWRRLHQLNNRRRMALRAIRKF